MKHRGTFSDVPLIPMGARFVDYVLRIVNADRALPVVEAPYAPMGAYGDLWGHMGTYGGLWGPLGTYGDPRGPMGTYGAYGDL